MPSFNNEKFWDLVSKKLTSEASTAELEELEELLYDPEIKKLFEVLSGIWNHQVPGEHPKTFMALERHIQRMKKNGFKMESGDFDLPKETTYSGYATKRKLPNRFKIGIGGMLATLVIALFIIIKYGSKNVIPNSKTLHPVSQVTTRPGSRTQLRLPDGTMIWLNASSNLTYDENFGKELREVNLSGEAFFDVVKDPSRPFIIHTKAINIKVLGTQFNVKAYPDDAYTETSLIRGKVEVTIKDRPEEKHFLKPNEKMLVVNEPQKEKPFKKFKVAHPLMTTEALTYDSTENTVVETSWVNNRLIFHQNETFAEMAPRLERWYGVHLIFENQKAANDYKPFVSFTNETITQALDDLKLAYKFNYKINGTEITITQ